MKIAFIHPNHPGAEGTGATHTANQVISGLQNLGHHITLYCFRENNEKIPQNEKYDYRFVSLEGFPYQSNHQKNKKLRDIVNEFNTFDVVHSYLTPILPAMQYIGTETTARVGVTLNAYGGVCPKNDLMFLDHYDCTSRSVLKCSACISFSNLPNAVYMNIFSNVKNYLKRLGSRFLNLKNIKNIDSSHHSIDFFRALSGHVKSKYVHFGFPENKIRVIPNPLDEQFFVPHKSDFQPPYNLLFVGSLKKRKGADQLVPIVSELTVKHNFPITLTIVGDGPLRGTIQNQIKSKGLEKNVELKGFLSNETLPDVYANHDLFIYPCRWKEPFGRVYLEALAAGTPVVATQYGDVDLILEKGGRTSKNNTASFVKAIKAMINNDELTDRSQQAKNQAQKYTLERIARQIEEMYVGSK